MWVGASCRLMKLPWEQGAGLGNDWCPELAQDCLSPRVLGFMSLSGMELTQDCEPGWQSSVTHAGGRAQRPGCLLGLPEHRKLHVCSCTQPGMGGEDFVLGKGEPCMTCATWS